MNYYTIRVNDGRGNSAYAVYIGSFQRITGWMSLSELIHAARSGQQIGQFLYW